MSRRSLLVLMTPLAAMLVLAGCGHSKETQRPSATPPTTATGGGATTTAPGGSGATTTGAGALQAEANAAATGDIPDNQVFLTFSNRAAGYSMKYPEGWAQSGAGDRVTFRDKNNIIRVVVATGAAPTAAQVGSEIRRLPAAHMTQPPTPRTLGAGRAIKVVYTTESAPNPVTGKRVTLMVDRYYLAHAGKLAIVDLGTPRGVDNVDAYRLISQSFRWR